MIKIKVMLEMECEFFFLILIGYFLRKYLLSKTFSKELSALVVNLLLPCNILASFLAVPKEVLSGKVLEIFLVSLIFSLTAFFLSGYLYIWYSADKKPSLQYATTGSNFGLLGASITEGLYGNLGILLASFYMFSARIVVWTLGIMPFCKSQKKINLKNLRNPCIIAVMAGSVICFADLRLPTMFANVIYTLGKCNFAMAMLYIGMAIEDFKPRDLIDGQYLYYSIIRLLAMPILAFAICRLMNASSESTSIAVLLSAMPAPPGSAILAEKYQMNVTFAAKCITVSTVYSILTIPACYFIVSTL